MASIGWKANRTDDQRSADSRLNLRSPKWWFATVVGCLTSGMSWAAASAATGDGRFTLTTGFQDAVVAWISLTIVTLIYARRA
jgi:hypothetical protein